MLPSSFPFNRPPLNSLSLSLSVWVKLFTFFTPLNDAYMNIDVLAIYLENIIYFGDWWRKTNPLIRRILQQTSVYLRLLIAGKESFFVFHSTFVTMHPSWQSICITISYHTSRFTITHDRLIMCHIYICSLSLVVLLLQIFLEF